MFTINEVGEIKSRKYTFWRGRITSQFKTNILNLIKYTSLMIICVSMSYFPLLDLAIIPFVIWNGIRIIWCIFLFALIILKFIYSMIFKESNIDWKNVKWTKITENEMNNLIPLDKYGKKVKLNSFNNTNEQFLKDTLIKWIKINSQEVILKGREITS